MLFVVKNKHLFTLDSENRTKSTRQFSIFYLPITNLAIYQRGVHYMGINPLNAELNPIRHLRALLGAHHIFHVSGLRVKIFNNLPPYIKDISNNVKKYEICLKRFLRIHSFYSTEEYFQHKSITS